MRTFEFVNYDDDNYVYNNPAIVSGLTPAGIKWAFTHIHSRNWHPLTTITHMLDCQLYGLQPAGHHLTNVLLHGAGAAFLFLALHQLTLSLWRSAFVAALFAVHPLRVESVAWVAERKDVLSGVFFALTLWAYARYARDPRFSFKRYAAVVIFFALGLLCKPTLVTVPLLLLLLDYWPLRRLTLENQEQWVGKNLRIALLEKVPLLVLSAAFCFATVLAQQEIFAYFPLPDRLSNAAVSYATYLYQMFYPVGLAAFYPHAAAGLPLSKVILVLLFLFTVSGLCLLYRKDHPYLIAGWGWYLGMLVPMIGIVQVGSQAHADRYTYLPQIGVYILLTWWAAQVTAHWRPRNSILGTTAAVLLTTLAFLSRAQAFHWRDSESLWRHALACTTGNYTAHLNLGEALLERGKTDEAILEYEKALAIRNDFALAHNNLGRALTKKGQTTDAIQHFQAALRSQPDDPMALSNLGVAMVLAGKAKDGIDYAHRAVSLRPTSPEGFNNLGFALIRAGRHDEAIEQCTKALSLRPNWAEAHANLGSALLAKQKVAEAIEHFREALRLEPQSSVASNNLAWLLATSRDDQYRNGSEALRLAEQAMRTAETVDANTLDTFAAALAENGRFHEAVEKAEQGRDLALARDNAELAQRITERLDLYKRGMAYHR